jgi:hypothetical protein
VVSGVFVDFGHGRVYALPEDGEEVMVFDGLLEMFEGLRPKMVVADSYLRRLLPTMTRLGGAVFPEAWRFESGLRSEKEQWS